MNEIIVIPRYQLAYGHNRLAACVKAGIVEVDLPVRELADYDMLCCMIDENNTQQSITPKVVFENVTAALTLAERLLLETENVNQFKQLVKPSNRPDMDDTFFWQTEHYSRAKSAISESGDGLGRDFVSHFMPSPPHNDTGKKAETTVLNTDVSTAYLKHARFVLRNCRDEVAKYLTPNAQKPTAR